jgi:hypothetical protein
MANAMAAKPSALSAFALGEIAWRENDDAPEEVRGFSPRLLNACPRPPLARMLQYTGLGSPGAARHVTPQAARTFAPAL